MGLRVGQSPFAAAKRPDDKTKREDVKSERGRDARGRLEQSLRGERQQEGGQRAPGKRRGLHGFFQRDFLPWFKPKGISTNALPPPAFWMAAVKVCFGGIISPYILLYKSFGLC